MAENVTGQSDWTQFVSVLLEQRDETLFFYPTWKDASRLSSMAGINAEAVIPEGVSRLHAGQKLMVQFLG
jgi:molybdopterin biosynthesis enzyme